MRILNMELDDFFLIAKPLTLNTTKNEEKFLYDIDLGAPINETISSQIYLGASRPWKSIEDIKFFRTSFKLKSGFEKPFINDERTRLTCKQNILFTGLYEFINKKGKTEPVISPMVLYLHDETKLTEVKIIAGGYKESQNGDLIPNLVLLVPLDAIYGIGDDVYFTCDRERQTSKPLGIPYTMKDILNKCKVINKDG